MEDPFPMYVALWRKAEAEEIGVVYGDLPNGAAGGFSAERLAITIVREHTGLAPEEPTRTHDPSAPPNEQPNIPEELLTLAHEYGHACSMRDGTRTPEYEEALDRFNGDAPGPLTEEDRERIRAEEAHADRFGAAVLRELGFDAWDAWDRRAMRARGLYEARFEEHARPAPRR